MSLLTTIQRACVVVGVNPPQAVAKTLDPLVRQMHELAQIDAEELSARIDWPDALRERAFSAVASIDQPGALPDDFGRFPFRLDDGGVFWDVAGRMGIGGPATTNQWRRLNGGPSPFLAGWRLFGGVVQLSPAPPAGRLIAFAYITSGLYGGKPTWETDDLVCAVPEALIALGVVWRWKQAKGFDYAEDMASYERRVEQAAGMAGAGRRTLIAGRIRLRADCAYPGVLGSTQTTPVLTEAALEALLPTLPTTLPSLPGKPWNNGGLLAFS